MIRLFERAFAKHANRKSRSGARAAVPPRSRPSAKTQSEGRQKLPRGLVPPRKPAIGEAALDGARRGSARIAKPRNAWAIQVGAFSRQAAAKLAVSRAAGKAPRLLGSARTAIIPLEEEGVTVYRARLVGLSESGARRACRLLRRKRIGCLAVPPEGDVNLALATP